MKNLVFTTAFIVDQIANLYLQLQWSVETAAKKKRRAAAARAVKSIVR